MSNNSKRAAGKRGAPRRNPVDTLFTRVWFGLVLSRSGRKTAPELEQLVEPAAPAGPYADPNPRRKYHAYEVGSRVPRRRDDRIYSPDLTEAMFPGTSAVLNSPLKDLLKQKSSTLVGIDKALRTCPAEVAAVLFDQERKDSGRRPVMQPFDAERSKALGGVGSFAALTAAVLLMKRAELLASPELRLHAWRAYARLVMPVARLPEVAPVADELFDRIDRVFKYWVYERFDLRRDCRFSVYETRGTFDGTDDEYVELVEVRLRGMLALKSFTRSFAIFGASGRAVASIDLD